MGHTLPVTYFDGNTIHKDDRVNGIQLSVLPLTNIINDACRDKAYQCRGYIDLIDVFDGFRDFTSAHSLAVKRNDLPVKNAAPALVFLDKQGIKTPITVSGDIYADRAFLGLDCLAGCPVTAVWIVTSCLFLITKMG